METIIEWRSPEHHFDKKTNDWYWIFGIVIVAASFLTFYFGNFLFGTFILIAGIVVGFLSFKETKVITIKIVPKGIMFGDHLHRWESYTSFWIEDEHIHGYRILMRPLNQFYPLAIIPVNEEVDLNDLRDLLLEFLEEEFLEESLLHKWFDKLLAK